MVATFVTFPPALDSETARWMLDHYAVEYTESPHALPFVVAAVKWYGQPGIPILADGDEVYSTPKGIFKALEARDSSAPRLTPRMQDAPEQVKKAFRDYNSDLGTATAIWAYDALLRQRQPTIDMITRGTPFYEDWFNVVGYPLIRWALRRGLHINPETTRAAPDKIRSYFDRAEALLADGRDYLLGDTFSIVDLTFAVAAAPVVLPPEYGGGLPKLAELPRALRPFVEECQARPGGEYVLRMYSQHRHR